MSPARVAVIPVAPAAELEPTPCTPAVGARYGIPSAYVLNVGNFSPDKNLPG